MRCPPSRSGCRISRDARGGLVPSLNSLALEGYGTMKMKFCSLLAGASLLALASTAQAAGPTALTDDDMDRVTAGAAATANAAALALGDFLTFTTTQTSTDAVTSIRGLQVGSAFGGSFSAAAAASALFQAAVATHADSSATLP